jgi:hypothetical protein
MLDDLRKDALQNDFDEFEEEQDESDLIAADRSAKQGERRFLGMTAVERMFLSIFFFMNVLVLGLALLVATQRIVF